MCLVVLVGWRPSESVWQAYPSIGPPRVGLGSPSWLPGRAVLVGEQVSWCTVQGSLVDSGLGFTGVNGDGAALSRGFLSGCLPGPSYCCCLG